MTDAGHAGQPHQQQPEQAKELHNPYSSLEGREEDVSVKELLAIWIRETKGRNQEDDAEKKALREEKKALYQEVKTLKGQIADLLKQVSSLITPTNSLSNASSPTWASIAASSSGPPTRAATPQGRAVTTPPLKKAREIIIRVGNKEDTKAVQAKSPEQILQSIKTATPRQGEQIASVRRLPSGDIALHAVSIEARIQLEKETRWCKGIAGSTTVTRRQFPVLVHGIRTTLDTTKQETIMRLTQENSGLHPGLEILRVAWPKKVYQSDKTHSSLIVEVTSEAMANHLLDHGFLESHQEHDCEYFERGCRVIQCFKCFRFGHMARSCKNSAFCHRCGKDHSDKVCEALEERKHCAMCKKEGHKPWMKICPSWKSAKKEADIIFHNRPYRFFDPVTRSPASTPSATSSGSWSTTSSESGTNPWHTVLNGGRKRRVSDDSSATTVESATGSRPRPVGRPPKLARSVSNSPLRAVQQSSSQ